MKKQIIVICILIITILSSNQVYAQGGSCVTADRIILSAEQTEGTIEITFDSPAAYAGAEVQILCGEGVEITSVTYNTNVGKAGPTYSGGFIWFSYFTGGNQISDTVTATITVSYSGKSNTSVSLYKVNMFTKDGEGVASEVVASGKVIEIKKEGATNPVIPPKPPEQEESTNEENTKEESTKENNANSGSNNVTPDNSGHNNADKDKNTETKENSTTESGSTKASGSGNVTESHTNGSSSSAPDASVQGDRLTPVKGINIAIVIIAVVSICINIALVFLYRKKRK